MTPRGPSPTSAGRITTAPPALRFPQPLASTTQRATLTLPPPPGYVLPVPPGLTLPPPQLEAEHGSLFHPRTLSTTSPSANGTTRRKRMADEQEADEESELEHEGSRPKGRKDNKRSRKSGNDGGNAGRKSFEYSEQELAERAARKRLRTRWRTGCSEQDKVRAINVALGKIGGARRYSWLNQTPSTPAQTMDVAHARDFNIHAGVIARELGISAEEVVDPPSPPPPSPVQPKPRAKPMPAPPPPISCLRGPASAGHCGANWQRGGERLGNVAAAANAGEAGATGAITTTGVAANATNAPSTGDDGDESGADDELMKLMTS
ncbi:hypothetical protein DL769_010428 [Monosporascus sp. CRB-8-3]|nr:hypothetical protein DL769_010428 [Monosporascus sp. CRB-8-3]